MKFGALCLHVCNSGIDVAECSNGLVDQIDDFANFLPDSLSVSTSFKALMVFCMAVL